MPVMDELHEAINLGDPIHTWQARLHLMAIERLLRGTGPEMRRQAIADIMQAVLWAGAATFVPPPPPQV
jgi:hypothetical protein